ncbi:clathrin adaptor [Scheffersomyces stipitis CBS 6054]|uniref:Clathrin adaptor n=1 Tax=Scheffersomyces stipitis (strain ATCC 58785 / CBS 6054 / NBRC 10063 / NRRL Y-11545) TaxID=322104 RepID=A3LMW1_PICST|nr:clathrin adaptor [Scheffersomyces stipitis CBS 6054]ABN64755.2 clathrin adaptor [Scheffersomyces stipitis CBS 6054]
MISSLCILHWPESDSHSQVLVSRRYRNDIPNERSIVSSFEILYKKLRPEERVPFNYHRGINYVHIRGANDILLLVTATTNINAMSVVVFLNSFYGILHNYLCQQLSSSNNEDFKHLSLDRDSIIDNVNLIFELIDECLDFGLIQSTDYNILREYIKVNVNLPRFRADGSDITSDESDSESNSKHDVKSRARAKSKSKSNSQTNHNSNIKSTSNHAITNDVIDHSSEFVNSSVLRTYSSAINWRQKGIFYSKNEIYIDIIEDCEFYYDLELGVIKRNEVFGTCAVKCYLSGMPVCRIGFNEKQISRIGNGDPDDASENETEVLPSNQLKADDREEEEDDEELESKEKSPTAEPELAVQSKKSRIPIRNVQFHQCIELATIYKNNLVTFIPPDDKFILMTYHLEQQKQKKKLPLIMIEPTFRVLKSTNKLQVLCVVSTNFKKRIHCQNLMVRIPINPNIFEVDIGKDEDCLKYRAETGEVGYKVDSSELVWKIGAIDGREQARMMAELTLTSAEKVNTTYIQDVLLHRGPIREASAPSDDEDEDSAQAELDQFYGVHGQSSSSAKKLTKQWKIQNFDNDIKLKFSIPMLAYSGLRLNYLSVVEDQLKYSCFPWVRYATESDPHKKTGKGDNKDIAGQNCDYRFRIGISSFQIIGNGTDKPKS